MSRIETLTPENVPANSKLTLDSFARNIGFTPNMMAAFAKSPITFNAWAGFFGAMSKVLDVRTRDSIGLAVSEVNGCNYCLSVHSHTAKFMARLGPEEILLARKGRASDPKVDAAVRFAKRVTETRGKVTDADLATVRNAGYTDANIIEIVGLVALYSFTNFFNNVADHSIDFPPVLPAGSIWPAHGDKDH